MATPDITAGEVMRTAASLMNDTARSVYTYAIQLPYLDMALKDLRKLMELNNSPVTNDESAIINIDAGVTSVGFGLVDPHLPDDLIEIQGLWESGEGTDNWVPVDKKEFIPRYYEGVTTNQFSIWAWRENRIYFPAANADIDLKLDYIKTLFSAVVDENSILGVINSDSYLYFRTAALLAEFIGENKTRADSLNVQAMLAWDVLSGIDNKGKQAIVTRRRPFRASYKARRQ